MNNDPETLQRCIAKCVQKAADSNRRGCLAQARVAEELAASFRSMKSQSRSASELERLQHNNRVLTDALWKACGDDEDQVNATIESQGELK